MVGDIQDISCNKCGKYLFTERDTEAGVKRENDNEDYGYDEIKDEFICDDCLFDNPKLLKGGGVNE